MSEPNGILTGGSTLAEHSQTLETVLQRARDFGITLNNEKCLFGVQELDFYGYRFIKQVLKPKQEKECPPPESRDEVKSFVGMIGYLSKFILRHSILTAPLRQLTSHDVAFSWGPEEGTAFQKLRDSVTSDDTMAFF